MAREKTRSRPSALPSSFAGIARWSVKLLLDSIVLMTNTPADTSTVPPPCWRHAWIAGSTVAVSSVTPFPFARGVALAKGRRSICQKTFDWALQARTANPADPELAKALGTLTYRKGDNARAVALLKESSLTRSSDAELWYYLGMTQFQAKDLPAGRQSLQKSLDLGLLADLAAKTRKVLDGKR